MKILLIAPQAADRTEVAGALSAPGHDVSIVDVVPAAAAKLASKPDLLFVDLAAPDAVRFLRKFAAQRTGTPVVCIADRRNPAAASEALRLGVVDIVGRPVLEDDVTAAVANAREMAGIAQVPEPLPELSDTAGAVFGTSPAMLDVLGLVRRVAQSRCTVMVAGERGTGREMVARAIHAQGPRRDRPFTKVVCADATSAEMDQVLNGGVPEGSTVYLEEIGELPPDLQARLEARVGGSPSDERVRFVAGAQPRVGESIERGHLRDALAEALSVVRIDMPPLRQRPHDIPALALHFLKQACRSSDQPAKTFSRGALALLAALPWPGNAGELRSLTERLTVLVPRGVVLLEDVLAHVRLDGGHAVGRSHLSLKDARDAFERDYITAVLEHHRGRIGAAARELGIERTNLYRKLKQLGIRLPVS